MKQNILALYLIKLSKWFSLVMPIIVLFYEDHGLGLQDVFILKSVYSVAAVTLEIPSGYLADVWGRKLYTFLWRVPMLFFHLHFHGISLRRDFVGNRANLGKRSGFGAALRYNRTI